MPDVGCAGLLVEDTFCGPLAALPPAGALLTLDDMPVRAGGCAANVAIDLVKQGISVDLAGCVGRDGAADALLKTFAQQDVGASRVVRVEQYPTSRTVILLIEGQDRRYLHVIGANRAFNIEQISHQWLSSLKVFYLGGLFALPGIEFSKLAALLAFCREAKVKTVVDVVVPQGQADQAGQAGLSQLKALLPLIDVFLPNDDEARAFTGLADPFDQLRAFTDAGANTVIVTRGGLGSVAVRDGQIWSCGAYSMDVVDPSGSGDAFTSGVIRSLLEGWGLPRTLRYASAVGASATRAAGTTDSVFSAAEAEAFLAERPLTVTEGR
ncbi:carbohydrate kinase family protein [Steroidobacter sp.]|uniref:carbohydrate kinase family protein n=1 Tax=Steroidobacter sp. TaxID=1978227 RepID=UPI001A5D7956|nr:carbohydrate kinase family protein [Steroidobacter sp.]MBL8270413.1 carbohydrate kinase family protein [Steroidobacter sp.]